MPTKAELEQELSDFKKMVIDKTREYPAGCDSGKEKFLRHLGVLEPTKNQVIKLSLEFTIYADELEDRCQDRDCTPEDVIEDLKRDLQAGRELPVDLDVGYWDAEILKIEVEEQ